MRRVGRAAGRTAPRVGRRVRRHVARPLEVALPRDDELVGLHLLERYADGARGERLPASPRRSLRQSRQAADALARRRHARHDGVQVRLPGDARARAVPPRRVAELLDDGHARVPQVEVDGGDRHLRGVLVHELAGLQPPQVGAGRQARGRAEEKMRSVPDIHVPERGEAERGVPRLRLRVDAAGDVVLGGREEVRQLPDRRGERLPRRQGPRHGRLPRLRERHLQQRDLHARPRVVPREVPHHGGRHAADRILDRLGALVAERRRGNPFPRKGEESVA